MTAKQTLEKLNITHVVNCMARNTDAGLIARFGSRWRNFPVETWEGTNHISTLEFHSTPLQARWFAGVAILAEIQTATSAQRPISRSYLHGSMQHLSSRAKLCLCTALLARIVVLRSAWGF